MLIEPSMIAAQIKKRKKFYVFKKEYQKRKNLYDSALDEILKTLREVKIHHKKSSKVRIAYLDGRIKEPYSIIRKAFEMNIPAGKIFDSLGDIVGIRIVVNNLKDIKSLIDEIQKFPQFKIIDRKLHNDEKGYRALHLKASFSLKLPNNKKGNGVRLRYFFILLLRPSTTFSFPTNYMIQCPEK